MFTSRTAAASFKSAAAAALILTLSSSPAGADVSAYTAFIKDGTVKSKVEKRLKDYLHKQLEKKLGSDVSVETYLKILDDYSHGNVSAAKSALGEEAAKTLLGFIAGSSGSALISLGWDFAKWSYSDVQKWAENLGRKKFADQFLKPRVENWRNGKLYSSIPELHRQFEEWFSRPEVEKSLTATKGFADRRKWIDSLKDEMWRKTLDIATKWRKYYRAKEDVRRKAAERERMIMEKAFALYRDETAKSAEKILTPETPKKHTNAKSQAGKTGAQANGRTGNSSAGKKSGNAGQKPEDHADAKPAKKKNQSAADENPGKSGNTGQKPEDPADAKLAKKKNRSAAGKKPSASRIPALTAKEEENARKRCLAKWIAEEKEKTAEFQETLNKEKEKIMEAASLLRSGAITWPSFVRICSLSPFSRKPEKRMVYPRFIRDEPTGQSFYTYPNDEIKRQIENRRKKNLEGYKEIQSLLFSLKEMRRSILLKAKSIAGKLSKTAELLEEESKEKFRLDDLPADSSISPQAQTYKDLKAPLYYFWDVRSYAAYKFGPERPESLNTAMGRISAARKEIERLLSYLAEKKDSFAYFEKTTANLAEKDLEGADDWFRENFYLLDSGDREYRLLANAISQLQKRIAEIRRNVKEFSETADTLDVECDTLLGELKAKEREINSIFKINRNFEEILQEAKGVRRDLEKTRPLYISLKDFDHAWNLKNISYNYTLRSPRELSRESVKTMSGEKMLQPVFVNKMIALKKAPWYGEIMKIGEGDIKSLFSGIKKARSFVSRAYEKGVFPLSLRTYLLFPKVKSEVKKELLPFIRQYADYADKYMFSKSGPLYDLPENIYAEIQEFRAAMREVDAYYAPRKNRSGPGKDEIEKMVRELYRKFKRSYAYGNIDGVMSCLSAEWSSSDGKDYADLEDHLRGIFATFNRFRVRINGLRIIVPGPGKYAAKAEYGIDISARLDSFRDVKHEERGTVVDYIVLKKGKPLIARTVGTGFFIGRQR